MNGDEGPQGYPYLPRRSGTVRLVLVIPFSKYPRLQFLLMNRVKDDRRFWEPVTGMVEEGEGLEEAALRELVEETGIQPLAPLINLDYSFTFARHGKLHVEYCYAVEVRCLDPRLSSEHAEGRWVEYGRALEMLEWEEERESLRRALNRMSS